MAKVRFYLALWLAKLAIVVMRITKFHGTNFPGHLALRICPDLLRYIAKPKKIIGVTGTNGKTSVSNLINDALRAAGLNVLNNAYGSNISDGIATSLIKGVSGFGKSRYQLAVLEIDERSAPRIFPFLQPDILLVTNLFRDSLKRNAHPAYIRWIMESALPKKTKLILNADDLISAAMAPENPRKYYGIEQMASDVTECINLLNDLRTCPNCDHELKYEYLRYHHIGKAYCANCGFRSQDYDYAATVASNQITVTDGQESGTFPIINPAIHNLYNQLCLVAVLRELGFSYPQISEMTKDVKLIGNRYSAEQVGDVTVVRQMAKGNNALSTSRSYDFVASEPGIKEILMMQSDLGDDKTWSENICWIYDSDFEFLNRENITHIVVTGPRAKDYELRFRYAGIPAEKITWEPDELKAPELLHYTPGESIYVFYGADALDFSSKVVARVKECALAAQQNRKSDAQRSDANSAPMKREAQ